MCLALGRYLKHQSERVRGIRENPESVKQWETMFLKEGADKEYFSRFINMDPDALLKEAEVVFERTIKEFGGKTAPRGDSLSKDARAALYEIRNLCVGKPVPEIAGQDIDGKPFKLSDYKGKVVVVDFWTISCGACLDMNAYERSLVKRMQGKPFALLGVNGDEDKDKLNVWIKQEQITWRSWRDGDGDANTKGPIASQFNTSARPTIYILDQRGIIRHKFLGFPGTERLDAAINALVEAVENGGTVGDWTLLTVLLCSSRSSGRRDHLPPMDFKDKDHFSGHADRTRRFGRRIPTPFSRIFPRFARSASSPGIARRATGKRPWPWPRISARSSRPMPARSRLITLAPARMFNTASPRPTCTTCGCLGRSRDGRPGPSLVRSYRVFTPRCGGSPDPMASLPSGATSFTPSPREVDAIIEHYYADIVGADWPPERRLVEEGYKTLAFPFDEVSPPPFQMVHHWDLNQVLGYLGSWSATQRYQKRTGADPLDLIRGELATAWGDPEDPRRDLAIAFEVGRVFRALRPSERRPSFSLSGLDRHIAELDRVVVSGEPEEPRRAVLARMSGVGHEFLDLAQVGIEDHGAVELDLDLGAFDGHFLEVPLAGRPQVAFVGGNHAVGGAVGLAGVEGLGVLGMRVVEDLELAHPVDRLCRRGRGIGSPGRCCRRGEA